MSISVRQIEAFRAVMISGTTKAAAELMHVSQPVISKLIAQMESRLGYALFDRTGNAIVPNAYARKLFEEALHVHERVEQFVRFANALGKPGTGSLTIYTSATFSTTLLPRVIARYHGTSPMVHVRIANTAVGDITEKLLVDPDSIGVTIWPVEHPAIDCVVLATRPVKLLMRPDHRLAQSLTALSLADLRTENLILHSDSMPLGDAIRGQMARFDCDWSVPFTVDSSETAYSLVEQGLGVFLCDAFASRSLNARDLVTREIETGIWTSVCMLRSRFREPAEHVRMFTEALRAQLCEE